MCQCTHVENHANADKSRCTYISDVCQLSYPLNPLQKINFMRSLLTGYFSVSRKNKKSLFWRQPHPPPPLPSNLRPIPHKKARKNSIDPNDPNTLLHFNFPTTVPPKRYMQFQRPPNLLHPLSQMTLLRWLISYANPRL